MDVKRIIYIFSRVTLLDEILGFIYWVFAIAGLYFLTTLFETLPVILVALMLVIYIIFVTLFYIFILKRVFRFFKGENKSPPAE